MECARLLSQGAAWLPAGYRRENVNDNAKDKAKDNAKDKAIRRTLWLI